MQGGSVDALTGIGLRDALAAYLREGLAFSQLEQRPLSLLVIDVDYLKLLNDAFGHKTGDKALLTVAEVAREQLADAGQVFRYGGDEFVVVLPGMSLEAASDWARAMLVQLQTSPFFPAEVENSADTSSSASPSASLSIASLTLSLSIGVASLTVPAAHATNTPTANMLTADTPTANTTYNAVEISRDSSSNKTDDLDPLTAFASQLFEQADQRAYLSKRAGRGRVTDSDAPVVVQEANLRLLGRDDALEQLRAFVRAPSGNKPTALPVYGQVGVGFSQFLGYAHTFAALLAEAVVYVPATSARSNRHLGALSDAVFSVPWLSWRDLIDPEVVLRRCAEHRCRLLLIVDRIDLLDAGSLLSLRRLLAASDARTHNRGTGAGATGTGDTGTGDTGAGDTGDSEIVSWARLIYSAVHTLAEDIREHVVLEPAITLTPLTEADGVRWVSSRLASQLGHLDAAQSGKLWPAIFALTRGLPARAQRVFDVVDAGLIAPQASAEAVLELLRHFLDARERRSHLPLHRNLFFGREQEINTITRSLQPTALVTIVAAHGMGKSRLASQVAKEYAPKVLGGVVWLSLQGLSNYEQCLYALAERLDVPVGNRQDPHAPVFHALQQVPTLLVCDDASPSPHVLALLEAVRQNAPATCVLATSQEPLSLAGEQRFLLEGLPAPTPSLTSSSYQLFMAHARQVAPQTWLEPSDAANRPANDSNPTTAHSSTDINLNVDGNINDDVRVNNLSTLLPALKRIHKVVAGMPLGLELAAAWCETYDVPTIADKLAHDALLLEQATSPLQAMFTTFWHLLAPYEQRTLASLTVFPSHFAEVAAKEIAGASPFFLTSLWHKAFLQQHPGKRQDDGRYAMPILLRQFASAQLAARLPWQRRAKRALVRYYVGWLRQLEPTLWQGHQRDTFARIHADIDAIDEAWRTWPQLAADNWQRAVDLDPDGKAIMLLRNYYEMRGHAQRGALLFTGLTEAFAAAQPRFAAFHAYAAARLSSRAGYSDKSHDAIMLGRRLLARVETSGQDSKELGWFCQVESINGLLRGHLHAAIIEINQGLAIFDRLQISRGWVSNLNTRAIWHYQQGNLGAALHDVRLAEWYSRRQTLRVEMCRALYQAGFLYLEMGNWREAQRVLRIGLCRAEAISFVRYVALCHVGLARCATRAGGLGCIGERPDFVTARDHLEHALRYAERSGSVIELLETLSDLASVCDAVGEPEQANAHFVRALRIAQGTPFLPRILYMLSVIVQQRPALRHYLPVLYYHQAASPRLQGKLRERFGDIALPEGTTLNLPEDKDDVRLSSSMPASAWAVKRFDEVYQDMLEHLSTQTDPVQTDPVQIDPVQTDTAPMPPAKNLAN